MFDFIFLTSLESIRIIIRIDQIQTIPNPRSYGLILQSKLVKSTFTWAITTVHQDTWRHAFWQFLVYVSFQAQIDAEVNGIQCLRASVCVCVCVYTERQNTPEPIIISDAVYTERGATDSPPTVCVWAKKTTSINITISVLNITDSAMWLSRVHTSWYRCWNHISCSTTEQTETAEEKQRKLQVSITSSNHTPASLLYMNAAVFRTERERERGQREREKERERDRSRCDAAKTDSVTQQDVRTERVSRFHSSDHVSP